MLKLTISTEHNAIFRADSICDECSRPAIFFLDYTDDEYCACFCSEHLIDHITRMTLELDPNTY